MNNRDLSLEVFDIKTGKFEVNGAKISTENLKFEILEITCKSGIEDFLVECLVITNSRNFSLLKIYYKDGKIEKKGEESFERYLDFKPISAKFDEYTISIEAESISSHDKKLLIYRRNSTISLQFLYTYFENFTKFELKEKKVFLFGNDISPKLTLYEISELEISLKDGKSDLKNGYLKVENSLKKEKIYKIESLLGLSTSEKSETKEGKSLNFTFTVLTFLLIISSIVIFYYYWKRRKERLKMLVDGSKKYSGEVELDSSVADMII